MADCSHWVGSDLSTDQTGDLLTTDGPEYGTQRLLRRFITVAGAYIWELSYGAGLPQYVGRKQNDGAIRAVILSQAYLEDCVARNPAPVITLIDILNGVNVTFAYTDAYTGKEVSLSFDVGPTQ